MPVESETSKRRHALGTYCVGVGLDIGYGGDPIVPWAITVDLPQPYTDVGNHPQNIGAHCSRLPWFADQSLDFVYSSHLIEDFSYAVQRAIISEWLRVLKPGGRLVILAPDQQAYTLERRRQGQSTNSNHVEADMSLATFSTHVMRTQRVNTKVVHSHALVAEYSWELVARRTH